MVQSAEWSLVIVTGGRSTRMGHDKWRVTVGGRSLIDRLLASVPAGVRVVVIGPVPPGSPRNVVVDRENPPGGGPLAGMAAGLRHVTTPIVVVTAVDLPFAGSALADLALMLAAADDDADAVMPTVGGRRQPLAAAYRTARIVAAIAAGGDPAGRSVKSAIAGLSVVEFDGDPVTWMDVDTPGDLAAAREHAGSIMTADPSGPVPSAGGAPTATDHSVAAVSAEDEGAEAPRATPAAGSVGEEFSQTMEVATMDEWITEVARKLGISNEVPVDVVLDVAKNAAHRVMRPAAPVTTYLVGMAVAGGMDPREAAAAVAELAADWQNGE